MPTPKKPKEINHNYLWTDKVALKKQHHHNLFLCNLFEIKNPWYKYLLCLVIGLFVAIITLFLVGNTGLNSGGMTALSQSIARITETLLSKFTKVNETTKNLVYLLLFWGLFFVLNIPLIVFSYKKVGKQFAKLSIMYALSSAVFGFALSYIPNISHILILGNTIPLGTSTNHIDSDNVFVQNHVFCLPFYFPCNDKTIYDVSADPIRSVFLIFYGMAFGLLSAITFAMLYALGGCKLGLDCVAFYYSKTKGMSVGFTTSTLNNAAMFIAVIIGNWIPAGIVNNAAWNWEFLFSANLIASICSMIIYGLVLNKFYPINALLKIEIYTKFTAEVINYLLKNNYPHKVDLAETVRVTSKEKKLKLITICTYMESHSLIKTIRQVDKTAAISCYKIEIFSGEIKSFRIGD